MAPTKTTQLKRHAFLAAYELLGNISLAAKAAGIERVQHYQWLRTDPAYGEAFAAAMETAGDLLEAEVRRRAVEGIEEPVIYQGELMGRWLKEGEIVEKGTEGATFVPLTVNKKSDILLMFYTKAIRPDKYRERREITGPGGGPLLVVGPQQ